MTIYEIKYNLLHIFYTDGHPTSISVVRLEIEQNEDEKIFFGVEGELVDELIRRNILDQDPQFKI